MSPVPAVAGRRCVHDGSVVTSGAGPRRPRCDAVANRHTVAHRRLSTPRLPRRQPATCRLIHTRSNSPPYGWSSRHDRDIS